MTGKVEHLWWNDKVKIKQLFENWAVVAQLVSVSYLIGMLSMLKVEGTAVLFSRRAGMVGQERIRSRTNSLNFLVWEVRGLNVNQVFKFVY